VNPLLLQRLAAVSFVLIGVWMLWSTSRTAA
jgi:hypothetical protein